MKPSCTLVVSLLLVPSLVRAAELAGRAVVVRGAVHVSGSNGAPRVMGPGLGVFPGETIVTEAGGHLRLLMQDKSILDIGPRSTVRIADYDVQGSNRKANLKVVAGRLWAKVRALFSTSASFTIESENAVAGVRGTELIFEVDERGQVFLSVIDGSVELRSLVDQAAQTIGAMQRGATSAQGIQVSALQEDALKGLLAGLVPERALGTDDRARVVEQLATLLAPETPSTNAPDLEARLESLTPPVGQPLVDLDPGQAVGSEALIHGRIVVEP